MKIKKICRLCVDAAMLAVTVLLMASKRTGIMLHILLGVVLFVLLVIHNTLNASWWGSVGRGQYSRRRWVQTVLNFSLLADVLVILISGVAYAVTLHRFASLLYIVMMFTHLGLHGKHRSHRAKN